MHILPIGEEGVFRKCRTSQLQVQELFLAAQPEGLSKELHPAAPFLVFSWLPLDQAAGLIM